MSQPLCWLLFGLLGLPHGTSARLPAQSPDVMLQLVTVALGCLCSVEEHFKDTKEKTEALLGDFFSSSHLQVLLSPESDLWSMDWESFDKQSSDWQRY